MRVLIGLVCMGFLATVAVGVALVQALASAWPLLLIALGVVVAVRLRDHHARKAAAPAPVLAASMTVAATPAWQPIQIRAAGWVLVPVWMGGQGQPQRHPVIDGDVITGDGRDG